MNRIPDFGDVYVASLTVNGSVQGGIRPVIIAQNNTGNQHSPTIEVIPMSSRVGKASYLPTHVVISAEQENGLRQDSIALTEQTQTINQSQLSRKLGHLTWNDLIRVGRARRVQSPFPTE